jgi:cation-transporting P-type ATPase I
VLGARSPGSQSFGFASIVVTQLAQTLDASRSAGGNGRASTAAAAASSAFLAAAVHATPLRSFLRLTPLGGVGWLLVLSAAVGSVAVSRFLGRRAALPRALPR